MKERRLFGSSKQYNVNKIRNYSILTSRLCNYLINNTLQLVRFWAKETRTLQAVKSEFTLSKLPL